MSKENRFSKNIQIKNRKASFEYFFIETFIAGIVLKGTEIKSLREGKANLQDAYCTFLGDEIWVKQMHISPYVQAAHFNHDLTRERKLLLNKKEINKLRKGMQDKGNTMDWQNSKLLWRRVKNCMTNGKILKKRTSSGSWNR